MPKDILFYEQQRFRQLWLWLVCIPALSVEPGIFWYNLYRQIIVPERASKIMGDSELMTLMLFTLIVTLLAAAGIFVLIFLNLETFVFPDRVQIKMFPFVNRIIPVSEIDEAFFRKYKALGEWGGWGIRVNWRSGRAYNVSGNEGVQIVLTDGRRILIGSKRAKELSDILRKILHKEHHEFS